MSDEVGKEEKVHCGSLDVVPFRKWRPNSALLGHGTGNGVWGDVSRLSMVVRASER